MFIYIFFLMFLAGKFLGGDLGSDLVDNNLEGTIFSVVRNSRDTQYLIISDLENFGS